MQIIIQPFHRNTASTRTIPGILVQNVEKGSKRTTTKMNKARHGTCSNVWPATIPSKSDTPTSTAANPTINHKISSHQATVPHLFVVRTLLDTSLLNDLLKRVRMLFLEMR